MSEFANDLEEFETLNSQNSKTTLDSLRQCVVKIKDNITDDEGNEKLTSDEHSYATKSDEEAEKEIIFEKKTEKNSSVSIFKHIEKTKILKNQTPIAPKPKPQYVSILPRINRTIAVKPAMKSTPIVSNAETAGLNSTNVLVLAPSTSMDSPLIKRQRLIQSQPGLNTQQNTTINRKVLPKEEPVITKSPQVFNSLTIKDPTSLQKFMLSMADQLSHLSQQKQRNAMCKIVNEVNLILDETN